MKWYKVAFLLLFVSPNAVLAHGGGLDANGCHHDRKLANYHCHHGPLAGLTYGSKAEAEKALASQKQGNGEPVQDQGQEVSTGVVSVTAPSGPVAVPYDRKLYVHWIDADRDCQDTRQEVLIAESVVPVQLDAKGCRVVSGQWNDFYTGEMFTDPAKLDIDHLVPLAESHRSGADRWDATKRRGYANDLDFEHTLIAVSAAVNRAKGDKDPAEWMPPNEEFHCAYIEAWVAVKVRWALGMDGQELRKVESVRHLCRSEP
jgi:hypothetical protein